MQFFATLNSKPVYSWHGGDTTSLQKIFTFRMQTEAWQLCQLCGVKQLNIILMLMLLQRYIAEYSLQQMVQSLKANQRARINWKPNCHTSDNL